ncbi:hypothetical protein [Streptomyces qinglanensis]|uniref:MinD-like ATPase involved in chromosome partitioning or flagellar assembly n=1 Tax=Streptomyces qinglanensis TaxID=943816 RepID=A0A1H9UEL9_9ACTN|nr:hypothetical protein [Streptomyces qinglanensis]SES07896.1 hypothetical protein SAMN05421870_108126 [Streptomyces qinglanensis]
MALIALAADKGAPGVTTTAVALSAVWPRRALLAEMDTAGGDLVYRSPAADGRPLDPNTGLLSLAATARRGLAAEQLWDHTQRLSGGLEVLVGLGSAEQSAGLAGQWDTVGRAFAHLAESPHPQLAADVIADCGRIGPEAASVALLPHAALVLLVARDEPEQIARVRDRALALTARLHGAGHAAGPLAQPLLGVLLVARTQGAAKIAGQVNDMLVASRAGARVVGVLAHDTPGAEQLAGRRRGRVERSLLVRSVRKIATDLHQQYGANWESAAPPQRSLTPPGPGQQPPGPAGNPVQAPGGGPAPGAGAPPHPGPGPVGGPAPSGPAEPLPSGPAPHPRPGHPGAPGHPGSAPGNPGAGPGPAPAPGRSGHPAPGSWTPADQGAPGPQTSAPGPQPTRPAPQAAPPGPQASPPPQAPGALPPVQAPPAQPAAAPAPGAAGQDTSPRGRKGLRARRRPTAPEPTPPVPLPGTPGNGDPARDEGAAS